MPSRPEAMTVEDGATMHGQVIEYIRGMFSFQTALSILIKGGAKGADAKAVNRQIIPRILQPPT